MRPLELEITGFGPFKAKTEIDLRDIELVALVGRTGAGKSTIIDAMTFALFGGIARYGMNKLYPVINQLSKDALVVMSFEVGGVHHKVLRKLVRTKSNGATTKDVRLEIEGQSEILGADEVNQKIVQLLGLNFDQFNKAVFLPQGKFAEFLHVKPSERQNILRSILDLDIYSKVQLLAKERVHQSSLTITQLETELAIHENVDKALIKGLKAQLKEIIEAQKSVEKKLKAIDAESNKLTILQKKLNDLDGQLEAISLISKPDTLDQRSDLIEANRNQVLALKNNLEEFENRLEQVILKQQALPDISILNNLISNYATLEKNTKLLKQKAADLEQAKVTFKETTQAEKQYLKDKNNAAAAYSKKVNQSKIESFVHVLKEGEPCPLCHSVVDHIPDHHHTDIDELKDAKSETDRIYNDALRTVQKAESKYQNLEIGLKELQSQKSQIEAQVKKETSLKEAEAQKVKVLALEEEQKDLQEKKIELRKRLQEFEKEALAFEKEKLTQVSVLRTHRTALIKEHLAPPVLEGKPLSDLWDDLLKWTTKEAGALSSKHKKIKGDFTTQQATVEEEQKAVVELMQLDSIGYDLAFDKFEIARYLERSLTKVQSSLQLSEAIFAETKEKTIALKGEQKTLKVYEMLQKNLEPRRFEKWLIREVLEELAEGATTHLLVLSNGAYSLEISKDQFYIRDHQNADELRTANSLSGGETFLASLSLALSLSDSIAGMAVEGAAKLESLFLDEGFGTLDAETLDVVANSIEELGSNGRMIGIVTHVEEIAQRMPVRIKVTKGPDSSYTERINS